MRMMSLLFTSLLTLLLISCSNNQESMAENETQVLQVPEYTLEVTTPNYVKKGEAFTVFAKLTYTGQEPITFHYGAQPVYFTYSGSDEIKGYTELATLAGLEPNESLEIEDTFIAEKKGEYELVARTEVLSVNGEPIVGLNNERYIEDDQYENSKITSLPMKIKVK